MTSSHNHDTGFAGRVAQVFVDSKLTPLVIVASLLLGGLAIWLTPREEEPQILVPMVDVLIPYPGAQPREVEERIVTPVEKLLWGIPDVEYLYSVSRDQAALITVRFKVGTELEPAVVRIHHKLREHMPEKSEGIGFPLVRSYTIDDVPFLALTFHSPTVSDGELRRQALSISHELAEIGDISRAEVIGGMPREIRIAPDPRRMAERNVTLLEYFEPLRTANLAGRIGSTKGTDPERIVDVEGFFGSAAEVAEIVVGIKGGRAVRVKDVADVSDTYAERTRNVFHIEKGRAPEAAVTLAISKRPGANASVLAERVLGKLDIIRDKYLSKEVSVSVSRNYGETAKEKSDTLIEHLLIASLGVTLLLAFTLGMRPALVVGAAVPVTLALTLLIYYLFGYTLNRVTLFALIFSIGILVDDAIVVIENIHRHIHDAKLRGDRTLAQVVVNAVGEVGNPTILATFTVIASILPMAFVSGLMGPYMRPIPVGASVAMVFSLFVAFTVSPWAAKLSHSGVFRKLKAESSDSEGHVRCSKLDRIYDSVMTKLLDRHWAQWTFAGLVSLMFLFAGWLVYAKVVRVKMLPFDNKSEFQVILDMPEGTPLEKTTEVARDLGRTLEEVSEVVDYQIYAGSAAPVNFNGLVRHYFLRSEANLADVQVKLSPKNERRRSSHEIAKDVRERLLPKARAHGVDMKVLEIPPGPPVLSTMVAEIYGPSHEEQMNLAQEVRSLFEGTDGIVDVDWTVPSPQHRYAIRMNRAVASLKNLPVDRVFQSFQSGIGGAPIGLLHDFRHPEPVEMRLHLPLKDRVSLDRMLEMNVISVDGSFIPLRSVVKVEESQSQPEIHHKNLKRVVYVFGDLAGREESPIYALAKLNRDLKNVRTADGSTPEILSSHPPEVSDRMFVKWDGEWQITYEVFRDLGLAFAVVLLLIYLLVVGWFESFLVPVIIMIPIPLSLIGIIPGHWGFDAFFTATSMIGFIAGAGIIVRNSIILVDFIELGLRSGKPLRAAVLEAGEVRFRPMLLTAAAVVVGSAVILFDPIFQGLALSLMMGEIAATLLSRFAVPLLYYKFAGRVRARVLQPNVKGEL